MLNGLDLFSGIGGLTLALKRWVRPVAYCEIDQYCQAVLLSRMADQALPTAPIWDDIKTLSGAELREGVDILYGGFPCQDISCAGYGKGLEGERSGLFFEIVRLVGEIRPQFVFLENVPAITRRGLGRVISEFMELRYDCRWTIMPAAEVGAPHLRKRWWFLARSKRNGLEEQGDCAIQDTHQQHRWSLQKSEDKGSADNATDTGWWNTEPAVGRVVNGLPARVDRIRGLGNAVVPQCAEEAFKRLMGLVHDNRNQPDGED